MATQVLTCGFGIIDWLQTEIKEFNVKKTRNIIQSINFSKENNLWIGGCNCTEEKVISVLIKSMMHTETLFSCSKLLSEGYSR